MPVHNHSLGGYVPRSQTYINWYAGSGMAYNGSEARRGLVYTEPSSQQDVGEATVTNNNGSGNSHENRQKSTTAYLFKRTV